jgi:asparagine synthase (glutamine-hydrolysing)
LESKNVTPVALGIAGSSDIMSASSWNAPGLQTDPVISTIQHSNIEIAATKVSPIVTVSSLSHFEDCVAFWLISEEVSKMNNSDCILSANGPDELFCGYDRFRRIVDSEGYGAAEDEIARALEIADRLVLEVGKVADHFGLKVVEPFLTEKFRKVALEIPIAYKILQGNDLLRKRIWRCYGRMIGINDTTVLRPKKAMQYGMGIHQVVSKMLKQGTLDLMLSG